MQSKVVQGKEGKNAARGKMVFFVLKMYMYHQFTLLEIQEAVHCSPTLQT